MVRREADARTWEGSVRALWAIRVAIAVVLVAAALEEASANSGGPILAVTDAPGTPPVDGANCTSLPGCHTSFVVNSGVSLGGAFTIQAPDGYEPGMTYMIRVDLSQEGRMRWGFQLTVLDELLQPAGTFAATDANTRVQDFSLILNTDRQYIAHTLAGTAAGQANGNSWTFDWTAPASDVGSVTFYAAGNAANNDETSGGDYIYTTTATVPVPEPGGLAAGLCALGAAGALARRRR